MSSAIPLLLFMFHGVDREIFLSIFIELIFCIVYEVEGFHCSSDSHCGLLGNG